MRFESYTLWRPCGKLSRIHGATEGLKYMDPPMREAQPIKARMTLCIAAWEMW
jgi:hypothetical protein